MLSSGVVTAIDDGRSKSDITVPVIVEHNEHICRDASSRNANTNVRRNSIFGSSASNPAPDIIAFKDWNTKLPISNAQPKAINTFTISDMTGAVRSKYDRSMDITPISSPDAYDIISIISP